MMKKENYDKLSSYSVLIQDMNSEEDSDKEGEV